MRGDGFRTGFFVIGISAIYLAAFIYLRIASGTGMPEVEIGAADFLYRECEEAIEAVLPYDARGRAFAKALFLGDKSEITYGDRESFRISGASHLLALSGMHLGIFYMIIRFLTAFIPGNRTGTAVRGFISIAVLFLYSAMTGMANSIARAFIMICVYELTRIIGRRQKPMRVLALSAVVILSLNPGAAADVGFQLSYCAMIGIFTIFPRLKDLVYTKNKAMKYVWTTIAMSVACQVSTLPLILWYFGYFPKYFLVTNLLCVPLSSVILALILASMALYWLYPGAGILCGKLLSASIEALVWITGTVSELP